MNVEEETCPCRFCERPTRMTGIQMCDRCWQIATAIEYIDSDVLRKILSWKTDRDDDE